MTSRLDETAAEALVVQVVDEVDDISADDWRAVTAGRGFYSSRRWLRFVEADPWYDVWYLVARSGDELLGVLPVYLSVGHGQAGVDTFYDPASVFVQASGVGDPARWRPVLLAGGRTGYDTELLLRPGLPAHIRRRVLAGMADRLNRLADAWGVGTVAFMYLTPDAAAELAPVVGTPPLLTDVTSAMHLDGCDSFDDFLGRMSGHRRRRIRHEQREFAASDFTIREARLSDVVDVVAPLLAAHHGRYGLGDSREMLAAHLVQHVQHLDDLGRVLLCEHGGRTVGALLAYEWEDAWYARAVGFADGLRGQSSAFFNLVYYLPIQHAIERGMRRYVVGPSTIGAKVKRGAELEPRWSLLTSRVADLAARLPQISAGWNDRRLGGWEAELRAIGHEIPSAAWRSAVLPPAAAGTTAAGAAGDAPISG